MIGYYRMDGTPYNDVLEWAQDHERMLRDRTAFIGDTRIWPYRISTVWLGLDHNFSPNGPPLIFETMVFRRKLRFWRHWTSLDQERYSTKEAAIAGHDQMVERFRPWWSRLLRMLQK